MFAPLAAACPSALATAHDVAGACARAKAASGGACVTFVDAVHWAPHALLDVRGYGDVDEWAKSLPRGARRTLAKSRGQNFTVTSKIIDGDAPAALGRRDERRRRRRVPRNVLDGRAHRPHLEARGAQL